MTKPCSIQSRYKDLECTGKINEIYVKWIEQGGGRIVPIPFNSTKEYMDNIFKKINGLYFIGGGDIIIKNHEYTQYTNTSKYLIQLALNGGEYFPIWGTCLGFELLTLIISQNIDELKWCPDLLCTEYSTNLQFLNPSEPNRMFKSFTKQQIEELEHNNFTYNWHNWILTREMFNKNPNLFSFFNVLSVSYSKNGEYEFISSMESKTYPLYLIQFHPEANNFGQHPEELSVNNQQSSRISQVFSDYFVDECKKNSHTFEDLEEEVKYDINNYPKVYLDGMEYIFK